jgi:hypothetical protein
MSKMRNREKAATHFAESASGHVGRVEEMADQVSGAPQRQVTVWTRADSSVFIERTALMSWLALSLRTGDRFDGVAASDVVCCWKAGGMDCEGLLWSGRDVGGKAQ